MKYFSSFIIILNLITSNKDKCLTFIAFYVLGEKLSGHD
jgi:hypothetical protein